MQPSLRLRRRGFGALTATLLATTAALAQQAPSPVWQTARVVPSVEGSRQLALTPWVGTDWSIQQYNELVEIRFPNTALAVDLGAVTLPAFDGALRDLSTATSGNDTLLRLVLGCACTLAIEKSANGRLLIGIVDAAPDPVLAQAALDQPGPIGAAAPETAPAPPRPVGRAVASGAAPAAPTDPAAAPSTANPVPPGPLNIDDVRARLIAQLEQAARDGLITLKNPPQPTAPQAAAPEVPDLAQAPTPPAAARADATPAPDAATPAPDAATPAPAPAATADAALATAPAAAPATADPAAVAAADPAVAATPAPAEPAPEQTAEAEPDSEFKVHQSVITPRANKGKVTYQEPPAPPAADVAADVATGPVDLLAPTATPVCFDDAMLHLPDPTPPAETAQTLSALNAKLIGEFDRVDPAPAEQMARIYLTHGLGVEALAVLTDFAPKSASAPALAALSRLVEDQPLAPGHVLSAENCGGVHAVWQALAATLDGAPAQALVAEARAGRAIETLPRALRAKLATRIGAAALQIGDLANARRLQALASRTLPRGQDRSEIALLEARLRRAEGAPDDALALLRPLRAQGGQIGAEATLMLADMVLSGELPGAVGSRSLRADLGALAFDQLGAPQGQAAFAAEADLTAVSDGREAALDLLAFGLARGLIDQAGYVDAVRRIGAGTGAADETPLAVLYDANPPRFRAAMDEPSFRIALAKSYADIGAPDLGRDLLRAQDLTQPDVAEALARAWLSAGEVDKAEAAVTPLEPGPVRASIEKAVAEARGAASALIALNQDREDDTGASQAWSGRLSALEEQLATNPDAETATRAALLSASLGESQIPEQAAKTLQGTDPELAARLQGLFNSEKPDPARQSAAEVPEYLKSVTEEAQIFKDLLNDG